MSERRAVRITSTQIAANDESFELHTEAADGEKLTIALPPDQLMTLIEHSSMAVTSIFRRRGAIPHVEVENSQTHLLESEIVGVELSFGNKGHLHFAFPLPIAKNLASSLEASISQALPSTSRKH